MYNRRNGNLAEPLHTPAPVRRALAECLHGATLGYPPRPWVHANTSHKPIVAATTVTIPIECWRKLIEAVNGV